MQNFTQSKSFILPLSPRTPPPALPPVARPQGSKSAPLFLPSVEIGLRLALEANKVFYHRSYQLSFLGLFDTIQR